MNIHFEINGRRTSVSNIADVMEREICNSIRDQLMSTLKTIRDPETGERPKITVKGKDFDNLSVDVSGSDYLIEAVKRRLA